MEVRLLITLGAAAALALSIGAVRLWIGRRGAALLGAEAAALATPGRATVLYFYTDSCGVCRSEQKPALERLTMHAANVVLREIDAVAERELAKRFRVLTVPTTVVLDGLGRVVAVNSGFADQQTLRAQIRAA